MLGTNKVSNGLTGPGPQTLIKGDTGAGYYGVLESADFINSRDLSALVGLNAGSYETTTPKWFKFSSNNKVLFIPMKAIRVTLSWLSIYGVGAVYGTDTNTDWTTVAPVMQDKRVTINGYVFRVRLMTGAANNPATVEGGEWNKLIYPIVDGTWAAYTSTDIGTYNGSSLGSCTLCQEHSDNNIVRRGFTDYKTYGVSAIDTTSNRGWRPVLELI